MPDLPMPGVGGGMFSVPYEMGGMPPRDAVHPQPIPVGALASALANATPDQQRTVGFKIKFVISFPLILRMIFCWITVLF